MAQTLTVGRLFDIRVGIHVSWLAVYGFMTYSIAGAFTGIGRPGAYGIAAVCALALFASVVFHEFAHALVARRFGVQTRAITLFLFGGVATLENEPPTPRAEIAIALAGPAASALLGVAAFGLFRLVDPLVRGAAGADIGMALAYLALANVVLALFNLLPSFPMDGGRVLRAVLWHRSRSYARSTATSAVIGIVFAAAVLAAGIALLASTHRWQDGYGWDVLLGGFLTVQSVAAYKSARRAVAAEGLSAAAARTSPVPCPTPPLPQSATIAAR
jgi:Zn-dependent protease